MVGDGGERRSEGDKVGVTGGTTQSCLRLVKGWRAGNVTDKGDDQCRGFGSTGSSK